MRDLFIFHKALYNFLACENLIVCFIFPFAWLEIFGYVVSDILLNSPTSPHQLPHNSCQAYLLLGTESKYVFLGHI